MLGPSETQLRERVLSLIERGKAAWTYGKIEVRAKLPQGQGIWPAIWMLPVDMKQWPDDGEIDIMEQESQRTALPGLQARGVLPDLGDRDNRAAWRPQPRMRRLLLPAAALGVA